MKKLIALTLATVSFNAASAIITPSTETVNEARNAILDQIDQMQTLTEISDWREEWHKPDNSQDSVDTEAFLEMCQAEKKKLYQLNGYKENKEACDKVIYAWKTFHRIDMYAFKKAARMAINPNYTINEGEMEMVRDLCEWRAPGERDQFAIAMASMKEFKFGTDAYSMYWDMTVQLRKNNERCRNLFGIRIDR